MDTNLPAPSEIFKSADALDERAFAGEADLSKQREQEFERRTQERRSDTDAYMGAAKDLQSTIGNREQVPMPKADLGPPIDPKQAQSFMWQVFAMGLVGAIGGRGHWKTAASAMTGAIEGFREGNQQKVEAKKAEFDREMKIAQEKQKQADKKYSDILENKNMSLNMMAKMMEIHAHANGDMAMAEAARRKDYESMHRLADHARARADSLRREDDNWKRFWITRQDKKERESYELTPEAKEQAARSYNATGKVPSMYKDHKSRVEIMNLGASLALKDGQSLASMPGRQQEFKANSSALTQNTKDLTAIGPYNEMLEMNANIAIDLAKKAIATNSKLANRPINWIRQNAGDNPYVAEFLAQTQIVSTEAARVLNNPRLVGQLTDSARHEMQSVINGDMPLQSFTRVLQRMQADGRNRVTAMEHEHVSLIKKLSGDSSGRASTNLKRISGDAEFDALPSGTEFIGPDNVKRRKP
jgi:hypothetical protein